MGRTRKPCPGCGRSESYPFRDKDRICNNCKKLINEALEHQEVLKSITGKMKIRVGERYYWNAGYYEGDLSNSHLQDKLLKIMVKLINESSEKDYADSYGWQAPKVLKRLSDLNERNEEKEGRLIERRLFGLLRGLDRLIRLALDRSYQNGKREGSSLIRMLASGQITIDEFQKKVERK